MKNYCFNTSNEMMLYLKKKLSHFYGYFVCYVITYIQHQHQQITCEQFHLNFRSVVLIIMIAQIFRINSKDESMLCVTHNDSTILLKLTLSSYEIALSTFFYEIMCVFQFDVETECCQQI